jgi:hypothetical protein
MALAFTIKAKSNATQVAGSLVNWAKQLEFANVLALTRTAYRVRDAEYAEMQRVFDRPTRFTLNSLYVDSATKLKPEAIVETKPGANSVPAGRYLSPQVEGGVRRAKSHEAKLGNYTLPSKFAQLDAYGNFPAAQYRKLISNIGADFDQSANSSRTAASKRRRKRLAYFKQGNIIFKREGQTITPQLILVDTFPSYAVRFRFFDVAERAHRVLYPREFDKAFNQAIATAR